MPAQAGIQGFPLCAREKARARRAAALDPGLRRDDEDHYLVMPVKAGIRGVRLCARGKARAAVRPLWIPAFAGMTKTITS